MVLTTPTRLRCRGLKLGRAIPLPTLRALVACYRENLYLLPSVYSVTRLLKLYMRVLMFIVTKALIEVRRVTVAVQV